MAFGIFILYSIQK